MTRLNWIGKLLATCLLMSSLGTITATTAEAGGSDPGYNARACESRRISPLAIKSNGRFYSGYYGSGGSALPFGDGRGPEDGTWGWDYNGVVIKKLVNLDWTHGRRYQGGTGQYKSAGPSPLRTQ